MSHAEKCYYLRKENPIALRERRKSGKVGLPPAAPRQQTGSDIHAPKSPHMELIARG